MPVCHQCHHVVVQLHVNLNIIFFFFKQNIGRGKAAPNYRENRIGRGNSIICLGDPD